MSSPLYRAASRFASLFTVDRDGDQPRVTIRAGDDAEELIAAHEALDAALEAERKEG